MSKYFITILVGIALGISSTALRNYASNHNIKAWDYAITIDNGQIIQNIKSKINPSKYDKFEQIYNLLEKQYFHGASGEDKINETRMMESALHGFVDGVGDPYTTYLDIQESSWLNQVLVGDQEFEWIGAVVSRKSDGIQIMEVLKWSPAQKAGLKPLDLIIKIDDKAVDGMSVSDAVAVIRWPKNTTVHITVFRASTQSIEEIDVMRDVVNVPSVSRNIITDTGSKHQIWYISLSIFGEDTYDKFTSALSAISKESIVGYIIDLRGNGGGFLPTAIDIASHFVAKGNIITSTRYQTFPEEIFRSDWREWANRLLPVVILVDGYSASASEVLALALKQNINATIIGEKTFGKWSIQTIYDFDDGSSIKYSIGRRYAPDGTNVTESGVVPDMEVSFDGTGYQASWLDTQLESAINYFN